MTTREHYLSWMRGWADGASCRAQRIEFTEHSDNEFASVYLGAYAAGYRARGEASAEICSRIGYRPTVLRAPRDP